MLRAFSTVRSLNSKRTAGPPCKRIQGAQYTTFRNSEPSTEPDRSLSSEHPLHVQPARNPPAPDNAQPTRPAHVLVDTSCSSNCTSFSAENPNEAGVVYLH